MKKCRFIAALLAILMLVAAVPFSASAEEEAKTYNFAPTRVDGMIYGFIPGSTVGDVHELFSNAVIELYDRYDNVVTKDNKKDLIGTGWKLKVNGVVYSLIIMGDVNGDGLMNGVDYTLIKRAYNDTATIDECGLLAAGVEKGGTLRPINYVFVKRACFGTYDINHPYTCEPYTADSEPGWSTGWI